MASAVGTPLERQFSTLPGSTMRRPPARWASLRSHLQFAIDRSLDGAAQDVQADITTAQSKNASAHAHAARVPRPRRRVRMESGNPKAGFPLSHWPEDIYRNTRKETWRRIASLPPQAHLARENQNRRSGSFFDENMLLPSFQRRHACHCERGRSSWRGQWASDWPLALSQRPWSYRCSTP